MARLTTKTGHLAPIALCAGLGLLLCSYANALSRQLLDPSQLILWIGVLLIALPIAYRLTSRDASPRERLLLACLLGLALYGVKVVRDAPIFSFSDEVVHLFNADQIASHHHLFRYNPILPVTPSYPGLEGATSALMTITGLSGYWAGVVVVGTAKVTLLAALFFLFQRVGGSARTAGLAAMIYAANFNFLYWGSQFSYESLSLPLFVVVMMAVAERGATPRSWTRDWAVPIVLGISAIVVTHHLTSYALAAFLAGLALAYWLVKRDWSWPNPWPYAALTTALASIWLLLVANSTFGYLSPVLGDALKAILNTASGEEPPRSLFQGKGPAAPSTPVLARGVAILAVGLLLAGLPFGLRRVWERHRRNPFALVFGVAAIAFFTTLALRLAPAAWETGNRAGEFLFIGLAFVLASAGLQNWAPRRRPWAGRALLTGALGIAIVGGAISGWPWDLQLASSVRASAEGRTISSPSLALAEWARKETSPDARFGAQLADARLLLSPGNRVAFAGKNPDIQDMLIELAFSREGWEKPLLRENGIRYIVADGREISLDATRGYSFSEEEEKPTGREVLLKRQAILKFSELPGTKRIYSSGEIVVYELGGGL
jgi:hypothetical protein